MLKRKTSITIPAASLDSMWVKDALTRFSEWFGGATAFQASGAWVSQQSGLILEPVVIVYSWHDENDHRAEVEAYARSLAASMSQECVAVEFPEFPHRKGSVKNAKKSTPLPQVRQADGAARQSRQGPKGLQDMPLLLYDLLARGHRKAQHKSGRTGNVK
jgi:hypothetical protein